MEASSEWGKQLIELEEREGGDDRYVLEITDEYVHVTGYQDFCMCESWYTHEEVKERFRMTGRMKPVHELGEIELGCDCEDHGHETT